MNKLFLGLTILSIAALGCGSSTSGTGGYWPATTWLGRRATQACGWPVVKVCIQCDSTLGLAAHTRAIDTAEGFTDRTTSRPDMCFIVDKEKRQLREQGAVIQDSIG